MQDMKRIARAAGYLYLVIIVTAGFSEGFVRSGLTVPGDAAATAENIMAAQGLFRLGLVSDLIAFISDAAVSVLLYMLLKPVSRTVSLLAASLRLLAHPAIASLNLLNHFAALFVLSDAPYLRVFEPEQLNALMMLFLGLHGYGYLIGGAFFGVHCLLLGYLLYKSALFPKVLGVMMVAASLGYVTESIGMFLYPANASFYTWLVIVTAVIAELSLCLYLMVRGTRTVSVQVSG